jgi:DNA-binding CsgD family transcriptional regulator
VTEEWRPTHHPNYDVSNLGRVRSRAPRGGDMKRGGSAPTEILRLLKPGIASNGYPTVVIGRGNTHTVHTLVATAFIGPCPSGQEVRHKDDNRANPQADNLEYGTRSQNIQDSIDRGRWNRPRKLSTEDIEVIKLLGTDYRQKDIAECFGVSRSMVHYIQRGRRRTNG